MRVCDSRGTPIPDIITDRLLAIRREIVDDNKPYATVRLQGNGSFKMLYSPTVVNAIDLVKDGVNPNTLQSDPGVGEVEEQYKSVLIVTFGGEDILQTLEGATSLPFVFNCVAKDLVCARQSFVYSVHAVANMRMQQDIIGTGSFDFESGLYSWAGEVRLS